MGTKLFEHQVATYSTYHTDRRNRATHFVGIPAIVFALLAGAALWRVPVGGAEVSAAWLIAIVAGLGWIALDLVVGLAMLAALIPMVLAAQWVAERFGPTGSWMVFACFFVGGWVFQLVGHAFEGRRPALVDNLFQAFIGPMFIMAEFLELLGLRRRRPWPSAPAA
jgi:uncharacterized membrane protein YGL010W